jgi:Zn-finger nucleic acid-binding protein
MDCPVCDKAMITMELHEVEVDYCPTCSGIWLDTGELEILLEDAHTALTVVQSFRTISHSTQRPRKCPICGKRMEAVEAGGSTVIDRCRNHHGIWFDRGELPLILRHSGLDPANPVLDLLRDMFIRDSKTSSD